MVFAGAGSPVMNLSEHWETGHLDHERRMQLNSYIGPNGHHHDHIPITFVYMSARPHSTQFDTEDLMLCELAAGTRSGTVQRRLLQGCNEGFLSYTGKRSRSAALMPSVHQGPGDLSKYQYSNEKCDPKYMLYMLKSLNWVLTNTSYTTKYFFRHIECSDYFEKSYMWISTIGIRTVNFACCTHCDFGDNHPDLREGVISELQSVIDCPSAALSAVQEATNLQSFVKYFDNPTPTTCCYQVIQKHADASKVTSHYFFVMDGLLSCYRIYDKMTMTTCGGCFQHNTSVAMFTQNMGDGTTQIHIGEHPYLDWLAWGGGKKGESRTKKSTKSKRTKGVARKLPTVR
jgi:hypothetical protein